MQRRASQGLAFKDIQASGNRKANGKELTSEGHIKCTEACPEGARVEGNPSFQVQPGFKPTANLWISQTLTSSLHTRLVTSHSALMLALFVCHIWRVSLTPGLEGSS